MAKKNPFTTLAVGEEEPQITSLAVGEETQPAGEPSPTPTPTTPDGEDDPRKARGLVPHDNPLGAF